MERFSRRELVALSEVDGANRCDELARVLTERIKGLSEFDFHRKVASIVSELRALGHDLWSFDASDDMEAWAPDYGKKTGPGLVVTFYLDDDVVAEWSKH